MPSRVVYLGDELSAAGFRLAGVSARVPPKGEEAQWLHQAMRDAQLVLVGSSCAAATPATLMDAALCSLSPLVMVMPDLSGAPAPRDPGVRVRRLIGVEA
jgi:vacuolar-type H+-ATPase subunit F/Vma7